MVNPTGNLKPVTTAEINAHSEQAVIELVYIKTANNQLGNTLANLSSALNTTTSVLSILTALQNMHNEISISGKSAFGFNFKSGGITSAGGSLNITAYESAYDKAASAYFGQAIDPTFLFSGPNDPKFAPFASALHQLRKELKAEIGVLSGQTPASTRSDPNNLLNTLKIVYNDLPSGKTFKDVEAWALDSYNSAGTGAGTAGDIQNALTTAITAAQSLNDTQKEQVRSFLFVFQEYYQSAAAVLSTLTQVLNDIARHISQ